MAGRRWWALGGVAVLVPTVAMGSLHTPPGRDLMRWAAETGARSMLQGELHIGAIEGSPFGTLRLHDVEIRDAAGLPVVTADTIEVQHRLSALLDGQLHVQDVEVRSLRLDLPRFVSALVTSESSETGAGPPLVLRIDRARVDADQIVVNPGITVSDLTLVASASVRDDRIDARIRQLTGRTLGRSFSVEGGGTWSGSRLADLGMKARFGAVEVELEGVPTSTSSIPIDGRIRWSTGALVGLVEVPGIQESADLAFRIRGTPARLAVAVAGRVAAAQARLTVAGPGAPWRLALTAEGVDPQRFAPSAPRGRLFVTVTATGGWARTDQGPSLEGRVRIRARGRIQPTGARRVRIRRLVWETTIRGGSVRSRLRLGSSVGRLDARARVRMVDGEPHLDRGSVVLTRFDVAALPGTTGGQGRATARVTASGPVARLRARAAVDLQFLRFGEVTIGAAQVYLRWSGSSRRRHLSVTGQLRGLEYRALHIDEGNVVAGFHDGHKLALTMTATGTGPIRGLALQATAECHRTRTSVRWTRLQWRAPGTTWNLEPGGLEYVDGRLHAPRVFARSPHGQLTAHLDVDLTAPLGADSKAELRVDRLDLGALSGLLPMTRPLPSGEVEAQLRFDGQRPEAFVQVDLRRLRVAPSRPPVFARVVGRVTSAEGRLTLLAHGREWGLIQGQVRTEPPSPWRSVAGWQPPTVARLRRARLVFDLDLTHLPTDGAPIDGLRGRVKGHFRLGRGAETISMHIEGRSITGAGLTSPIALDLAVQGTSDAVDAEAMVGVGSHRASVLAAHLRHGLPALLGGIAPEDLRGDFRAHVDALPLEPLRLRLGPDPKKRPISGTLTLRAQGGQGTRGPLMDGFARMDDVRLDPRTPPMAMAVQGRLNRFVTTATATFSAPELGRHRLSVRARTPEAWPAHDLLTLLERHIQTLSLVSTDVALSAVRSVGGIPAEGQGTLQARIRAGPGLKRVRAQVSAVDLQMSPAVAPLSLAAHLTATSRGMTLRSSTTLGRARLASLDAHTPARLTDLLRAPASVWNRPVTARVVSRYPLQEAWVDAADQRDVDGEMTMTASVAGTFGAPRFDGHIALHGLRLGKTHFERFQIDHRHHGDLTRLQVDLSQNGGGRFHAQLRWTPTKVDARLRSRDFMLGFMTALANLTDTGAAFDGTLTAGATLTGSATAPRWSGILSVENLRLAVPGLPSLDQGRFEVDVEDRTARVSLAAQSGPGRVWLKLRGELPTLLEPRLVGTFSVHEVPLAAMGKIVGVTLDGQLAGHRSSAGVDAEVVLLDGRIRLPDATPRPLHRVAAHPDVVFRTGQWRPLLGTHPRWRPPFRYSVRVRTRDPVEVRGQPVQARLGLNLVAHGRPHGVSLAGDVRVAEGSVRLFGRRYRLERADLRLGGRTPADPRLDVRLSHRFEACTFVIDLLGTAQAPRIVLSAQPDIYDDKQLFAFLFGASPDGGRYDKTPAHQTLDLAAWLVLEHLQSRLKQALPFDTLAVDLGEGADSGQANVTLGKWLTDQLFVAYAYHHRGSPIENNSEGLLRYRFLGSWLFEMVFGDRGNGGADVLWTKRW